LKLKQYAKIPGVATFYYPFLGNFAWDKLSRGKVNEFSVGNEFFAKHSDKKMIVTNGPVQGFGNVSVFLHDPDSIREYLAKEPKNAEKLNYHALILGQPQHCDTNAAWRAVFTDFFLYEDLHLLQKPLWKILENKIAEYVKTQNLSKTEFKKMDLAECLNMVMVDWIALVLFGYESAEPLDIV